MPKSAAVLLTGLVAAIAMVPVTSKALDAQAMLDAPAWKVEYQYTFTASSQGNLKGMMGPISYTTSLNQSVSAAMDIDLRSGGPSISMLKSPALTNPGSMSSADAQKYTMDMMSKMDQTANWMDAGPVIPEGASDSESQAIMMARVMTPNGTASVDYLLVSKGDSLFDETGAPFKSIARSSIKGSGGVVIDNQFKLEVDSKAKTYIVCFGLGFADRKSPSLKQVDAEHTERPNLPPHDTTTTSDTDLERLPGRIQIDDPKQTTGDLLYLQGTFDPAKGRITGEHSLPAHYSGYQGDIPGTLTVSYTLTPKP